MQIERTIALVILAAPPERAKQSHCLSQEDEFDRANGEALDAQYGRLGRSINISERDAQYRLHDEARGWSLRPSRSGVCAPDGQHDAGVA